MQIQLTPQLEDLIQRKLDSGRYSDANEVVLEALRLLDERDQMARLREALAVGEAQVARGEVRPWTPQSMERLMREAEEDERQGLPIRDEVLP
jgi:antitoxin ParD1/3/4